MRSTVIGFPPYHVFSSEKLEDTTNDFGAASLFCEQLTNLEPFLQQGWTNTGNHEASMKAVYE
ncbi:hypothetical protein Bca52824_054635 [Brassica carinata]|uniref:Uncharacterized protein n=1 Tax=Brassica carinata TaxID=52824 RepID=A0A8X7R7T0_BRACI|nr:hypothetical protein Bca52824_054635 [Brassica carinata]